jgi:hypothetical protein
LLAHQPQGRARQCPGNLPVSAHAAECQQQLPQSCPMLDVAGSAGLYAWRRSRILSEQIPPQTVSSSAPSLIMTSFSNPSASGTELLCVRLPSNYSSHSISLDTAFCPILGSLSRTYERKLSAATEAHARFIEIPPRC